MNTRSIHIATHQQFRTDALHLLHQMKAERKELTTSSSGASSKPVDNLDELQRNHDLAIESLENCILCLSLTLCNVDAFEELVNALLEVVTPEPTETPAATGEFGVPQYELEPTPSQE